MGFTEKKRVGAKKFKKTFSYKYLTEWESDEFHKKIVDYFVRNHISSCLNF